MSDAPSTGDDQPTSTVRLVRALMERHGLRRYRQSAWLADAVGISYSQAHRRMNGTAPWSLEDIEQVASFFGETLVDVLNADGSDRGAAGVAATMRIGDAEVACRLWLGDALERPPPGTVVAVRTSAGWSAVAASEATDSAYRVERLEAKPSVKVRKSVAVLDDDEDLTRSICAHFEQDGYLARPFFRLDDLPTANGAARFDAYVIDWIVGQTSAAKAIAALRARDAACPIVVLTAQVIAGVVDEAEIAEAVARHDLVFAEKPVRMSILSATLARAFAQGGLA